MARKIFMVVAAASLFCSAAASAQAAGPLKAIGIENQYADVIAQVGGAYVSSSAIETDPNTDPHAFEASPAIAADIAGANLIVENGLGYDDWADKMILAAPRPARVVINVQHLLGLADATPNPHVWYDPATMPAVAAAVAQALAKRDPAQAAYFQANAAKFDASLQPWRAAIASFKAQYGGVTVAVTEPVGDDLLQALGVNMATPFTLQAAIMNGTDPSPQDVAAENALFTSQRAKILIYNQQVTDPLTQSFLTLAEQHHVPVVGVYETMPAGYHYQDWMLAETAALRQAVAACVSTARLTKGG